MAEVCCFAVVNSGGRSSSNVRHTRRVSSLVLCRQPNSISPLSPPVLQQAAPARLSSPPVLQRAAPTSLSLPTAARNLSSVSSITVSLPRSFAVELVAPSRGTVTDVTASPADDGVAVMRENDSTSLSAGLYHCIHRKQYRAVPHLEHKRGAHLPVFGHLAHRWRIDCMASATLDLPYARPNPQELNFWTLF